MIIGRLIGLEFDPNDEHMATTWQVATDYSFRNIIAESQDDSVNKTSIVFKNVTPDAGKSYYGRAMVRTRLEGWSNWHNLDITVSEKQDTINNINTLPSVIGAPRLKTTCDGKDAIFGNHPIIGFKIVADGYATVNNTKHVATSWYIEDIENNVIWKSEYNDIDKLSIDVNDAILKYNRPYKIRACFHSETKDVSDLSSLTVCTFKEKNPALRIFFETNLINNLNLDITNEIVLNLPIIVPEGTPNPGDVCLYFNIVEYTDLGYKQVFTQNVVNQDRRLTIPGNTLMKNKTYILQYRADIDDNWEILLLSIWKS